MDEDRCKTCIWACKDDDDEFMRLCRYLNIEVYRDSMPCGYYERYDGGFYHMKPLDSAIH